MADRKIETRDSEMVLSMTFLPLLVVNILVVFVANAFFPEVVVLGTRSISPTLGIFLSMAVLAMVNTLVVSVVRGYEQSRNRMFSSTEWMVVSFVVSFLGIWMIARVPEKLGLGVASWTVVLVLALAMDFLQGMVMMQTEKWRKKSS